MENWTHENCLDPCKKIRSIDNPEYWFGKLEITQSDVLKLAFKTTIQKLEEYVNMLDHIPITVSHVDKFVLDKLNQPTIEVVGELVEKKVK